MKTEERWQAVKSPQGRRWWSCGGVRRLPLRQHVTGSIFKRIRQAEKHPRLLRRDVEPRNSNEKSWHKTAAKCQSRPTETFTSSPCWSETRLSCVCQHSQFDVMWQAMIEHRAVGGNMCSLIHCHLRTWRPDRTDRQNFRLTFWMSDLSNSKIVNSQTGVKEGEKVYLSTWI